jgi:hypothetical protein
VRQVATLSSSLENASRTMNRLLQNDALSDILCTRLFAVHVLASLGGIDGGCAVPVWSRGNQDRIDVLAIEQISKVAVGFALVVLVVLIGFLLDRKTLLFLHVTDGDKLDIFLFQKTSQIVSSAISNPNTADDNSFAGRNGTIKP